mmetsp:Transcript_72366/g.109171  ORF Transcript_72366/g.109171 Transcript_72366/m.109171 type:complete len:354 (-) Transcript_72366:697-1758(-)
MLLTYLLASMRLFCHTFFLILFFSVYAMTVPLLEITMVGQQNNIADPIAAAIAAAAEIAKNGGFYSADTSSYPSKQRPQQMPLHHVTSSKFSEEESDEDDYSSKGGCDDGSEEDAERRMARSRERNREHARRTRLRKKAQLEALQSKVKGLQAESKVLKQSLEECSIASILVGLSSGSHDDMIQSLLKETSDETENDQNIQALTGGKRKRFACDGNERVPQPLKITIDGKTTVIGGGRTHINWKTGVYSDESGSQRQLTQSQLESLRRERNRMHAKMTRDRKKNFIANIEKTIGDLESHNQRMKNTLADVIQAHFGSNSPLPGVAAPVSPEHTSMPSPPQAKRVCHGFSLITS